MASPYFRTHESTFQPQVQPGDPQEDDEDTGLHMVPPGLGLMLLEARAPWEAMALAAVSPWLSKMP